MTQAQIVVVTGTDTEIGKTFVTCGLARHLRDQGIPVLAIKPVESGVASDAPGPGEDGVLLAAAAGQQAPAAALTRLRTPVAPPLAAAMESVTLNPAGWCEAIVGQQHEAKLILVEGAGGLLSPLAEGWSAVELARALGAAVLVVASDRLGTLNHTRLTLRALAQAGLPVLGVALSAPPQADASTGHNRASLATLGIKAIEVARDAGPDASCWATLQSWLPSPPPAAKDWVKEKIDQRRRAGLLRDTTPLPAGTLQFSGNDYLGLAHHPDVRRAAAQALETHGLGPRGSALICGYTQAHADLEAVIAAYCGTEAALVLPTGYAANVAAITALCSDPGCTIFSDALNHASMIDGCRMAARSGAKVHIYPHGDTAHLEEALACSGAQRKIIITESVFSMDGDHAPLAEIQALSAAHGATLICDSAHATLLFSPPRGPHVHVGTLSKAVGAQGGFIACSEQLRTWILNAGRPYVFSTALPVPVVAAAREAFAVAAREPHRAQRLFGHARRLRGALQLPVSDTPIVPIVLGDPARAMAASRALAAQGIHVPGIRPPTVPPGTARLRVTLSAAHTEGEVERLIRALLPLIGPTPDQ